MTPRQRFILATGAFVLLLSCLFVPWYAEDDAGFLDFGYTFFFSPNAVYLDLHRLLVEWVGIVATTVLAFVSGGRGGPATAHRRSVADTRPGNP